MVINMSKFEENVIKLLGEINSRLDKVDEKFVGIDSRFDKLEADIDEIKEDNQFIKRAVIETNEDVKTILEDQKSIHEMLGEHEISIRTLRRKPV